MSSPMFVTPARVAPRLTNKVCSLVVEQYRCLEIEKSQAIGQLLAVLQSPDLVREYLDKLDKLDQTREDAKIRPSTIEAEIIANANDGPSTPSSVPSELGSPGPSTPSCESDITAVSNATQNSSATAVEEYLQTVRFVKAKNDAAYASLDVVDTVDPVVTLEATPNPLPRHTPNHIPHSTPKPADSFIEKNNQMHWPGVRLSSCALEERLVESLRPQVNEAFDLGAAKLSVGGCTIPDQIWDDILANRYVDLDAIFAVINRDTPSDSRIASGDDWVVSWELYSRATTSVYPSREKELFKYGRFITKQFRRRDVQEHERILDFDRKCRMKVTKREDLLLTDFLHCTP